MLGMAIGDAVGACVEFRPRSFMLQNPVEDLKGGGTWGLEAGQWTDDTSMALCLAASLVAKKGFNAYDQLVRYKWWYKQGYMSSTGKCFDIGKATSNSIQEFSRRQRDFQVRNRISSQSVDQPESGYTRLHEDMSTDCSTSGVAGNGALMRLAPIPLFFCRSPRDAIYYAGKSALLTHGDQKAADACRYFAALMCAAMHGYSKVDLLHEKFYVRMFDEGWFEQNPLHRAVQDIAEGSFKKARGYDDGIRAGGYVIKALEAALWAFWQDNGSFQKGVLLAVNLGDDTDTTAAIYGQLAGVYYGVSALPKHWSKEIYAKNLIECLSQWIEYEGGHWFSKIHPEVAGTVSKRDCLE
ncbi:unnamed protein product [Didymodactylos carnosus]|uniref:ADP-ribosylglycohydrolase n=1 Tax=Didymodactylos carnosus TaxID=1234261 RepID=A0A814CU88_9BILA|nr:unnamed protein product [Didymodactylos carnosus]CAF0949201.1 unnamed protein product [Didymodactylos carnosus]CAF3552574.1 unnamed protein product [Didymodactylos carnosus]CAF3725029.1 unnamed protein product [Didymodactylos carnosus]